MHVVDTLIEKITEYRIIQSDMFDQLDLESVLAMRDSTEFEVDWLRVYDITKNQNNLSSEEKRKINLLRETTFKRVYEITANPELSGYVSDDFGLIGSALFLNINDPWLNSLWQEYYLGNFPHTELKPLNGSLKELVLSSC
ncbi:MAG: hypothetical protein R3C11_16235 [Planctomycetaceae bacterium]